MAQVRIGEVTQRQLEIAEPPNGAVEAPTKLSIFDRARLKHGKVPYLRRVPFASLAIIGFIAFINIVGWVISAVILHYHPALWGTAALAYSFGLRHALDADHISAIDLMTRRFVASGQRPVTVGTWFSLGHSTIVIVTSIVVAATSATVSKNFDSFGTVGGIIGSSVSTAFLILLGIMNAYILYKLIKQLNKILAMSQADVDSDAAWKVEGGGILFRMLKKLFRIVDRPWKMYPVGVLFGLGFDTSSEVALLGISSIQAAQGTSIWVILIFPLLFTCGMCLIDTCDGALMLAIYVLPNDNYGAGEKAPMEAGNHKENDQEEGLQVDDRQPGRSVLRAERRGRAKDPIAFLYYSIVLTSLTIIVALVIGTIQLLTMLYKVQRHPSGPFWDGVAAAGDDYEILGGSICGAFIVVGLVSVICYKPWRRRIERKRGLRLAEVAAAQEQELHGEALQIVMEDEGRVEVSRMSHDQKHRVEISSARDEGPLSSKENEHVR